MLHIIPLRRLSAILLLALLTSFLPAAPLPAQASEPPAGAPATPPPAGGALSAPAPPAAPQPAISQPIPNPLPPGLALEVRLAPDPLAIGETAAVTITITNRASAPADALEVTAPTPDGTMALPGPNTVGADQGWRWSVGHLDGNASTTLTGALRLLRAPAGDAVLLTAQARASGLDQPVQASGGALTIDRALGAVTLPFVPGTPTTLRSPDGRVSVQFPARAALRALTLRYGRDPLLSLSRPPARGRSHEGLGTFFLDATDVLTAPVHQFSQPLTITVSYTPEQLQAHGISEPGLTLFWYDDSTSAWIGLPTQVDSATHTASATVDHFTPFQLSDGTSASTAFIPSLQGFQTELFTGAASYQLAIETPAGRAQARPEPELLQQRQRRLGRHAPKRPGRLGRQRLESQRRGLCRARRGPGRVELGSFHPGLRRARLRRRARTDDRRGGEWAHLHRLHQ